MPVTTDRLAPAELLAGAGLACVAVALVMNPHSVDDGPVLCPIRLLTGFQCPGCGLTRSWVHAVHGDASASFAAHPFGLPILVALAGLVVVVLVRRVRRRTAPDLRRFFLHPVVLSVLMLWLVWAAARLVVQVTGLGLPGLGFLGLSPPS